MGHNRRLRQTGHARPTMAAHAIHNSSHLDGYTWQQCVAEREALAKERGIRFERNVDDDDLEEAA
jgi:hypothetical protein